MKCPKCGQEYEGSACPNCEPGPEIIVNNADYLRRKEAYEKKQAEKESASSHTDKPQKEPEEENADDRRAVKKKPQEQPEYEEIDYLGMMKKVYDTGKEAAGSAAEELKKRKGFFSRYRKRIIAAVLVVCVLAGGGFGIYKLASRKNYVLYMSSGAKIYNVAGLENNYVCENKQAVFAVDNRTFYTPQFPQQIDADAVTNTLASDNGEYFAATVYDEGSAQYALYTWKDGQDAVQVSKNAYDKDIGYITNKGKVIYSDVEVVNEEGGLGAMQLYVYDASGKLTLIEGQLKEYFVYAAEEKIACYNKNNVLYLYDYDENKKENELSDSVRSVYAESAKADNFFTAKADTVNTSKNAHALIFSDDGEWYYHNISEQKTKYMMQELSSSVEIIYEEKAGYLYLLAPNKITYAELSQDGIKERVQVDTLLQADYEYLPADNILVYINADGTLCYSEKGKKSGITSGVTAGTLSSVDNTQNGITYIKDGVQYYCASVKGSPVKMCEQTEQTDTAYTLLYKNRLYFYDADGQLYSCAKKGNGLEKVGDVSRFWLGTKYQ